MNQKISITNLDKPTAIADLSQLEAGTLAKLHEDLTAQAKLLEKRKATLHATLIRRFSDRYTAALKADGKDTGTTHVFESDLDLTVTIPKNVEWDQEKLREAFDKMTAERARHYAKIKISVDESKYNAAPPEDKKLLEPARTIKPGKVAFEFKPVKAEE